MGTVCLCLFFLFVSLDLQHRSLLCCLFSLVQHYLKSVRILCLSLRMPENALFYTGVLHSACM